MKESHPSIAWYLTFDLGDLKFVKAQKFETSVSQAHSPSRTAKSPAGSREKFAVTADHEELDDELRFSVSARVCIEARVYFAGVSCVGVSSLV